MFIPSRSDVSIGDLVEITDWNGSDPDSRVHGIVCSRDTHHPDCDNSIIFIAEVVWSSGEKSWIDVDRISIISKEN